MKQLNVRIDEVTRSQIDHIKSVRRVGEQLLIKQLLDEEYKRVKIAERQQMQIPHPAWNGEVFIGTN